MNQDKARLMQIHVDAASTALRKQFKGDADMVAVVAVNIAEDGISIIQNIAVSKNTEHPADFAQWVLATIRDGFKTVVDGDPVGQGRGRRVMTGKLEADGKVHITRIEEEEKPN